MSFRNKVVLVTGASSGIGAATAIRFAEQGAQVAMVGRNEEKLKDISEKCEASGCKPLVILADVKKDEDLKRIINDTIDHFKKLDVLVNSAGIIIPTSILADNAIENFDKILATNLRAAVFLTNLASPHLIETQGNIINISSIAALTLVLDHNFAYGTSKAGLDSFSRSVALELAPKGVRVNVINPGLVRTDLVQNIGVTDKVTRDAFWDSYEETMPMGKIGAAEEIADLILFVASDKAKSITGSSIVADNGMCLIPRMELAHVANGKA